MSKLKYLLKIIFKKWFLALAYIILIALTVMFVVQEQLRRDTIAANNGNEPNVSRSIYQTGVQVTYPDNRKEGGFAGLKLCKRMKQMKTPERVSFFTWVRWYEVFENGKMLETPFLATDGDYWKVMNFQFTEGQPYTEQDVAEGRPLIVISETWRKRFFDNEKQVIGRQVELNDLRLAVCGVVKDVPYSAPFAFGEFWMPYTVWGGKIHGSANSVDENAVQSIYVVQAVARKKSDFAKIHQEYATILNELNKEIAPEKQITWTTFGTRAYAFLTKNKTTDNYMLLASDIWRNYLSTFWMLLVPLLALMCLNFASANERGTEMGIRRMIGARKSEINSEFIFENATIIFIGIVFGVFLGYLFVYLYPVAFIGLDTRDFNGGVQLPFTCNMFLHLLLAFAVFLAASTALSIVRVSRQSILRLLKGDEL